MPWGRISAVLSLSALAAFGAQNDSVKASAASVWALDSASVSCSDPLESPSDCWRQDPRWANMEIGFPGARASLLSLSSLEPMAVRPFFHFAADESPYGLGGTLPFQRLAGGLPAESWTPVTTVDTPITSLHWTRGALGLNQFTLNLGRMVGERAYFALQYHSDRAESQFYDYAFNVHQPYLSGWGLGQFYSPMDRDSLSLVIQDTSHAVSATHVRPRLGFWLGPNTVIETYADWSDNASSLARPTHPARSDSTQSLYPAEFSSVVLGAVAARRSGHLSLSGSFRHASWSRELDPQRPGAPSEKSEGLKDHLALEASYAGFARPRLRLDWENALHRDAFFLGSGLASEAWSDQQGAALDVERNWGPMTFAWSETGERRSRPDGKVEWLWGGEGKADAGLPLGFRLSGGAGWNREGASDDALFRHQPALGLYPNSKLKPRSDFDLQAGGHWESRWVGVGAEWDRHRYGDVWLPKTLPDARDTLRLPDSLALALDNYDTEIRELMRLSLFLKLGRWKLDLRHAYLLQSEISDSRGIPTDQNAMLPERVFKGQLLWRRKVLQGRLGLQTEWDWEWFSARHAWASDLDGFSRVVKLDEYLALDFTARMEVKSFLLYFRAMNLNHDRYATEPGVHPPGVNFRFGVDWRLWN